MKCYMVLFPSILEINAFDASHKQPTEDEQRTNTDLVSDLQFLFFKPSENQLPKPLASLEKTNLPSAHPSEACKASSWHRARKNDVDKKALQTIVALILPHASHALSLWGKAVITTRTGTAEPRLDDKKGKKKKTHQKKQQKNHQNPKTATKQPTRSTALSLNLNILNCFFFHCGIDGGLVEGLTTSEHQAMGQHLTLSTAKQQPPSWVCSFKPLWIAHRPAGIPDLLRWWNAERAEQLQLCSNINLLTLSPAVTWVILSCLLNSLIGERWSKSGTGASERSKRNYGDGPSGDWQPLHGAITWSLNES